jgi:hypothetical protein
MSWDARFRTTSGALTIEDLDAVLRKVAKEFRLELWRDKTDGALDPGDDGFAESLAEPDVDGEPLVWRLRFSEVDGERPTAALRFTREDDGWVGATSSSDVDPACFDDFNFVYERTKELLGGVDEEL